MGCSHEFLLNVACILLAWKSFQVKTQELEEKESGISLALEVDRVRNRVENSRGPFYREENKYKEIKVSCDQELGKGTS